MNNGKNRETHRAEIGEVAFYGCSGLKSITLSRKTQVGGEVFPGGVALIYSD